MISLPIPLIVSLITLYLLVQAVVRGARLHAYWGLLAACSVQGLMISLVHHYGAEGLRLVLPVTAAMLPPLAWLAFQSALFRPVRWPRDAVHLLAPAFTGFCMGFAPVTLDAVVPGIFLIYGAMILVTLQRRRDDLPLARLEAGQIPVHIWRALAIALIVSAFSDVLIAVSIASGRAELRGLIVSSFSSLSLLAIAVLSLSGGGAGKVEQEVEEAPAEDRSEDQALMARLETVLRDEQLYLDADLTLARLARRLHVPVKQLSAAINRQTGENVSRYVNAYRIRHACDLLRRGRPVTETIFASGFNTKSNFNREFRRVTGASPREWLEGEAGGEGSPRM